MASPEAMKVGRLFPHDTGYQSPINTQPANRVNPASDPSSGQAGIFGLFPPPNSKVACGVQSLDATVMSVSLGSIKTIVFLQFIFHNIQLSPAACDGCNRVKDTV